VHGDERESAGWIARVFDVKAPASTVGWKKYIEGEAYFISQIVID